MKDGAGGGGRTHTSSRIPDFESGASANSATPATKDENYIRERLREKKKRRRNIRRRMKFILRLEAHGGLRPLFGDFLFAFPDGQTLVVCQR